MGEVHDREQTFDRDGVGRITLPLPTGPRHVHCYLVDGTLFDTGLGLGEAAWPDGVERIAITHMHPDHVGGAEAAARATGAPVFQGGLDYAQCERVWGSADWPERIAAWFVTHGVPADEARLLIDEGHAFASFVRFQHDPSLLYEGSELAGWRVLELPGHADGHLGFLRDDVLVGGDSLLDPITPAVGLYPESRPDPLGDYLRTLERIAELAPRVVYPGHGEPILEPAARALAIVEHHARRLDRTAALLDGRPLSGFEVSRELFGGDLSPPHRRFAVAETLSHLERLVAEGAVLRTGDDDRVLYTSA